MLSKHNESTEVNRRDCPRDSLVEMSFKFFEVA